MKKILTGLLLIGTALTTLNSCTKKYYDVYETVPTKVMVYTIYENDWTNDGDNRIMAKLKVNELTQYYMNQGLVTLAVSKDNEATYSTIPAVIDATSYSFDYKVGEIIIFMEDPIMEENITIHPPSKMIVKVGLTESDYVE